ncbi:uncharacterized protein LOC106164567 isoform X1 [Lingula anatina]|uniref:Uncharacterized protein LOC106164567 isoform X1 n=1 Tax=Lingula anatina TaxID=7574 RepID=A0A1S3IKD3_LINAN|nr:uncharacterized protein LOC106164567 isoform X1 [Lingula anatina]|eukprot:XP_013397979.1 uncharacterized protein LOC106164567 isoform X1 [Lingula anatina]
MNFQGLRFRSPSQKVMVGLSVGIIVVLLMFLWIIQGPQLHLTGVTSYNLMDEIISTLRDKNDTDVKQYGDPFFYKEELGGEVASMLQGDVDKFIPELKMTLKEYDRLEKGFYGHLMRQQYDCRNRVRAGISEDGGWEVCMDPQFAIKPGSCLVYSFGLGNEWSFDKYMSKSCTVYGFDPSIGLKHEYQEVQPNMWFYNIGLFRENRIVRWQNGQRWTLKTLGTVRQMLKHTDATIDYLKMDVEESEWDALKTAFKEGSLKNVKQLAMELHIWNFSKYITPKHVYVLRKLEELGFKIFFSERNGSSRIKSKFTGRVLTWANNVYFVNTNYLQT